MSRLRNVLIERLEEIPGLEGRPSKVAGGSALYFRNKEIAHFHNDNEIDVRLTKKVIKLEGLTHHADSRFHLKRTNSEWIELRFKTTKEVEDGVRLFKLALKQYQ